MASLCSLDEIARHLFTETLDRQDIGTGALAYWSREWERNLAQRPLLAPGSFCDVRFEDINRNAMVAIERVFDFVGIELDDIGRRAMQQWEANNPRHQGGLHVYDGTDYGLTAERVRESFAAYFRHFGG